MSLPFHPYPLTLTENSLNGSETPKYERYSSPTTPSLGYWHHGFNSDCRNQVHGVGSAHRPLHHSRWTSELLADIGMRDPQTYCGSPLRCRAIGDDFILMDDNWQATSVLTRWRISFRGRNRTNGMASVCSRHESDRVRLGRSRKTNCWPPTTPTNSPRTGTSSSGRVGAESPNSRLIASLTLRCLIGAQRCSPSVETIPPTEK
ncbi:hypothetical protein TNCV_567101 [Trichonephila clavipes]|nr:hypothetical protein TNCV_567101 [Trichonephila clavipes]